MSLSRDSVNPGNGVANRLGGRLSGGLEKVFWLPNSQLLDKDLVQFVVVVLARVDQNVVGELLQHRNNPRQTDNLRPRAQHGHDFNLFSHRLKWRPP